MDTRRCIYCLEEKSPEFFNREHVVPQSFGRFGTGNLVLDCVCATCNGVLGRKLDEKLAVDSPDGFERYRQGLKAPKDYRTLGRRSTSRVELEGLDGVPGEYVPNPDAPDELGVRPRKAIGFAATLDGPWHWYAPDAIPSKNEVLAKLGAIEIRAKFWRIEPSEVFDLLRSKGFKTGVEGVEPIQPPARVRTRYVALISHPEFRAAAKIAFNYLAHIAGDRVALMPQFNPIRRYVHAGVDPDDRPVWISSHRLYVEGPTGRPSKGHCLVLHANESAVIAQVSLMSNLRYVVTLSNLGFRTQPPFSRAHFFDLERSQVVPVGPPAVPVV